MAISKMTLAGFTQAQLLEMHYLMALLRRFEEKSAEEYTRGKIAGFMHLYIGQEAVGAGCISALRPDDKVLASYREHGLAIAKGMEPGMVMAELFGKITGLRDADRLDSLGAIGILRWAITGAIQRTPQTQSYYPDDPFAEWHTLDDRRYMLDHFFTKLLKLSNTMSTQTGRALAQQRTAFMHTYLNEFRRELGI